MPNIEAELEACEARVASLQAALTTVQQQLSREEERATLLRRLVELGPIEPSGKKGEAKVGGATAGTLQKRARKSPVRLEDAVIAILKERNEALHISKIRAELVERGISIPGKGTDSNIIARLIRHPQVEREVGRRGFYRLAVL